METFHQKVIRNVQGKFLAYKTTEVVGDKALIANLEWANPEDVDGFFAFANQIGSKVVYFAEGEVVDEDANTSQTSILQVGFVHNGVMHHINDADEDDDEDDDDEYESDEEYEVVEETHEQSERKVENESKHSEQTAPETSQNPELPINPGMHQGF